MVSAQYGTMFLKDIPGYLISTNEVNLGQLALRPRWKKVYSRLQHILLGLHQKDTVWISPTMSKILSRVNSSRARTSPTELTWCCYISLSLSLSLSLIMWI